MVDILNQSSVAFGKKLGAKAGANGDRGSDAGRRWRGAAFAHGKANARYSTPAFGPSRRVLTGGSRERLLMSPQTLPL